MTAKATNGEHAGGTGGGTGGGLPWRAIGWSIPPLLLTIPLIGRFPWTLSDIIIAGAMMAIVGGGLELALRMRNRAYTFGAGAALAASFLLFWVTGAVGIIGSERDDANLLFLAVILVALLGAIAATFRPRRMAAAMTVAAAAQFLVPFIAWAAFPESREAILRPEVPVSTIFFTGLWLASAWLFRRAAAGERVRN